MRTPSTLVQISQAEGGVNNLCQTEQVISLKPNNLSAMGKGTGCEKSLILEISVHYEDFNRGSWFAVAWRGWFPVSTQWNRVLCRIEFRST